MSEDKTLKEIALELLEKYKAVEEAMIFEYSGSITEALAFLDYKCELIRRQIEKAAEPKKGKWTLTTTAQPKKAGYYLSTCIDSQWGVTANEAKRYLSVCYYEPIPGHHWYDPLRGTVVAWSPLPEMFQGSLDEYVQARRDEYYRRMSEEGDAKLNK